MSTYFDNSHVCRIGTLEFTSDQDPSPDLLPPRDEVQSWLAAILQAEHLSLLLGNGLTIAQAGLCGAVAPSMASGVQIEEGELQARLAEEAERSAVSMGRGSPNLEDYLRVALALEAGLRIAGDARADDVRSGVDQALQRLLDTVVVAEQGIRTGGGSHPNASTELTADGYLVSFLLTFASRTPTRDRLHIFSTNYDRVIEHAADLAGLRVVDRFVGALTPRFRASRMDVDLHYSPPGLRGEPRFLEGVIRFSKLHGSIDWILKDDGIIREGLPFGGPASNRSAADRLVFPNAAKDYETTEYPYAELFRDFSAAICRPNSVLVTYGYGFGDDHINRVIRDMLTIPSTHLLVASFDAANGRVQRFVERSIREGQVSLLLGSHFGDLRVLVDEYLPKPSADDISWRRVNLLGGPAEGE